MTIPARISVVTLGVADLRRAVAFYEALGWQRAGSSTDGIAWFRTAGTLADPYTADGILFDSSCYPLAT